MKLVENINKHIVTEGRTKLIIWNVLFSFLIKGWSAIVTILMVPLTINCLGTYKNGAWLTISSMLIWIDQMDIGLGNGLRNKLAIHVAHNDWIQARKVVSSTMAMLFCIVIPILLIILCLVWYTDIYSFLNIIPSTIPDLRIALVCATILICSTFVLKFISNVYMGMQLPAISNLLMALGQTTALIATWILYILNQASFFWIVVVNTAAPLLIYLLSYPSTFYWHFPQLRPSFRLINLRSALELGNLGIKFFWLQIASIIQFMTANILISKFFTPEMVTPYQITYRYLSIVIVAFSVVCMPFWNATTDAFEKDDMKWIQNANHRMNIFTLTCGLVLLVMILVSPWVYNIWIGDSCEVPYPMTVMMGIYIFQLILSMRYSYFLNGIGALRLQLYMTVSAIVFIPLAWIVSNYTHNIIWFMAVMCICNVPGLLVNIIQFNKIINRTAKGFWRK